MNMLIESRPDDARCVMGLTMTDLYPANEDWDFVFGIASPSDRIGVFSFSRYSPLFDYEEEEREVVSELNDDEKIMMLRRSLNVMVHETGHMMGLPHCVYFKCMMNGANSLEESDAQPSHTCPACLRKLHYHLNFDVRKRYEELLEFYTRKNLDCERIWLQQRLDFIEAQ